MQFKNAPTSVLGQPDFIHGDMNQNGSNVPSCEYRGAAVEPLDLLRRAPRGTGFSFDLACDTVQSMLNVFERKGKLKLRGAALPGEQLRQVCEAE